MKPGERSFEVSDEQIRRGENRLVSKHLALHADCMAGRITKDEAKARGRELLEEAQREFVRNLNAQARRRGLTEIEEKQLSEKWLRVAVEEWNRVIDDVPTRPGLPGSPR